MVTVKNSTSQYSMTSTELISGTGPGQGRGDAPVLVYLTDFLSWYIMDPDDLNAVADNWNIITAADGIRWRRLENDRNKPLIFDDFLGDLIADEWALASGSDAQALDPVINAALNGTVRLTSGNVGGGDDAVDSSVLTHGLNWQADQGNLIMQARVKVDVITNVALFVGFTDVIGTAEVPIHSAASGDTVTDNAANAAGVMFDTAMATDKFGLIGTKAGTQTAFQDSTIAPVAATYDVIRVEIDSVGAIRAYINGVAAGAAVAAGITATTPLTPVLSIMGRTTASPVLDADYIMVQQDR